MPATYEGPKYRGLTPINSQLILQLILPRHQMFEIPHRGRYRANVA